MCWSHSTTIPSSQHSTFNTPNTMDTCNFNIKLCNWDQTRIRSNLIQKHHYKRLRTVWSSPDSQFKMDSWEFYANICMNRVLFKGVFQTEQSWLPDSWSKRICTSSIKMFITRTGLAQFAVKTNIKDLSPGQVSSTQMCVTWLVKNFRFTILLMSLILYICHSC